MLYCAASFVAGACTTKVISPESNAAASLEAATQATVVEKRDAPAATSPSGGAKVVVLARGNEAFIGELTMKGGAVVPEHADATEEYIHVLEGTGAITIDGRKSRLQPGTTVFMPAGAVVSFANGETPLRAIQVFADPDPASKYDKWIWDRR
jgi:quercetin dioxygenase-like cupin family protein